MSVGLDPPVARLDVSLTAPAPATQRDHLLTVVFGSWMTAGLFLDGYFHQNIDGPTESFVTPWHAVFYAGFCASAFWLWTMARRRATGRPWLRSLPPGYEAAGVGVALFALGGAGDAAWHNAFGVERGIDALLSPTHLLLFAGLVLLLSAPFRAVVAAPSAPPAPWLVVASMTSITSLTAFFLNFVWGLGIAGYTRVAYDNVTEIGEVQVIAGVASMLVTTAVLFGAAWFVLSRGRVPRATFTLMFGIVALLVSAAFDEDAEGIVAALLAGITLDVCLRVLRRRGRDALAPSFAVASGVLWLAYVLQLVALDGIAWGSELWVGAVVLNTLAAYAIGTLSDDTAGREHA